MEKRSYYLCETYLGAKIIKYYTESEYKKYSDLKIYRKMTLIGQIMTNEQSKSIVQKGTDMRIEIVKYVYDAISFEFRNNQVSNWIKVKLEDGTEDVIHDVCVIRTLERN